MSGRMKATRVCDALSMALMRRGWHGDVTVHRGQGSQSCAKRYHGRLAKHGLHASMSQRGGGCDNACAESLSHTLKVGLTHGNRYATRAAARPRGIPVQSTCLGH